MFRRLILVCVLLLVLVFGAVAQAQEDIPAAVDFALADLSTRVGHQVSLNNIWQWQWEGDIYPDTSLGCPQPGEAYAQVQTNGFQFLLTYQDLTYDYRVSADGQIVILCETFAVGTAPQPDVPVDPDPAAPPAADLTCPPQLPSRLTVNEQAQLRATIVRLNVRSAAGLNNPVIQQIPGGGIVNVLAGPECVGNIAWWQVEYGGVTGWAAEGQGNLYYLDPGTDAAPGVTPPPVVGLECPELLPPRVEIGEQARVRLDLTRLNLRATPSLTGQVVTQLPAGATVTILDGPECGPQQIAWWQIQFGDTVGWAAEGQQNFYYLEPLVAGTTTTTTTTTQPTPEATPQVPEPEVTPEPTPGS